MLRFYSRDKEKPDSEIGLNNEVSSIFHVNNEIFVFGVKNQGIYYYNAETRENGLIEQNAGDNKIASVDNNVIRYDNGKQITYNN